MVQGEEAATAALKQEVISRVDALGSRLSEMALDIHRHPEGGLQEYHAVEVLTDALSKAGFEVERGVAGLDTAFVAKLKGQKERPAIALLCEYDALPEIGHACGHNLIGVASTGAGMALAGLGQLPGTVFVIGAPGEETHAGKAQLVEAGVFKGVDAAMMFHPAGVTRVVNTSAAIDAIEFVFTGKAAHAASAPHMGINALDGVIHMFNGVNALREHLPDSVRIHGIISEGGIAPNIVPAHAAARFYIRAPHRELLNEVVEKVQRCAVGGALMAGAKVTWHQFEPSNDNLITNCTIAAVFERNLQEVGVHDIAGPADSPGSTDMGNVSQVVPSIHAYVSLGPGQWVGHSPEFAQVCGSKQGLDTMMKAVKALALTTLDLMYDEETMRRAQEEFSRMKKSPIN